MLNFISKINIRKERIFFYSTIFFIFIGGFIYFNSLEGEFIGDDVYLIAQNDNVKSLSPSNIKHIFSISFFDRTTIMGRAVATAGWYYRPLCILSYAVDYAVWGLIPFGYHLMNIILHVFSTLLLFLFLKQVTKKGGYSFIVSILFLVYPIHSPNVASISGRTDLLCLAFFLLALLLYRYYATTPSLFKKNIYILVALFSFFMALLSKEMAVTLPAVIIFSDLCFNKFRSRDEWARRIPTYGVFFLVFILYLAIRRKVIGVGIGYLVNILFNHDPYLRILTVSDILLTYIKTLFFPFPIYCSWRYAPIVNSYWGRDFFVFLTLFILICVSAFISWRRNKVVFFGIGWFFITYFPVSNIIPAWPGVSQYNLFVGKQFLYIPLVGFCIACVSFILQYINSIKTTFLKTILKRISIWVFIWILIIFSMLTIYYNIYWMTSFYYNLKLLEQIPESVEARNDLGIEYFKQGIYESAIHLFAMAIKIQEEKGNRIRGVPESYLNLLKMYINYSDYEKAREICNKGLKRFPENYYFYYYLASLNVEEENYKEANFYYRKALQLNPLLSQCASRFLNILMQHSDFSENFAHLLERIESNPSDTNALFHIASLYRINYLYEKAISFYKKVLKIEPKCYVARSNLAYCYEELERKQEAREERDKISF